MNYTNINENINIYFKEIRNFQNLTLKDERILFTRVKEGDQKAVTEIFNRMAKLAVAVAKTYTSKADVLQDLIQEANCGVLDAINKFDLSMGFRFSSYARWWMKSYIGRYLETSGVVRSTNSTLSMKIRKISTEFFKQNQREITEYELMDLLEQGGEVITDISAILPVKVDNLADAFGDEDFTLEDSKDFNNRTSSDNDHLCTETNEELSDDINRMMSGLTDREKAMVKMKFGIGYYRELGYDEIARRWSELTGEKLMSEERCRQIVTGAIKKMKKI